MPRYLAIAEKVYASIETEKLFTDDMLENLNCLMTVIRRSIKGTEFKLKYNFINFEECLTLPLEQCTVKVDLSVMPKFKNKGEFILWLAGFIERITIGGKAKLPPIATFIPSGYQIDADVQPVILIKDNEEHAKSIVDYFKSEDFIKKNTLS